MSDENAVAEETLAAELKARQDELDAEAAGSEPTEDEIAAELAERQAQLDAEDGKEPESAPAPQADAPVPPTSPVPEEKPYERPEGEQPPATSSASRIRHPIGKRAQRMEARAERRAKHPELR